jgi:hypothetical protein
MGLSDRFLRGLCATALFLGIGASSIWAQTSTAGTVQGQVMDEQNAAVPGTEVKVVELGTGLSQSTLSNDAGRYIFSQVPPGKYNILFTKQGFATYEVNSQTVDVGARSE